MLTRLLAVVRDEQLVRWTREEAARLESLRLNPDPAFQSQVIPAYEERVRLHQAECRRRGL